MAKCPAPQHWRVRKAPSPSGGTVCRFSVTNPPGFGYFDYVNPQAPKGGGIRFVALGTFDNFNQAIAGVRGLLAAAARTICDTLLVPSLDEASTHYGLIAEAVSHPPSFASTSFRLRAAARHHDGNPITVDDVIYSFEAYRKYNRFIGAFYSHVLRVEQSGEREITFTFHDAVSEGDAIDGLGKTPIIDQVGKPCLTQTARQCVVEILD